MEIPESKAKGLGNYQRTPNPQPDRRSIWPSSRPSQPLEEEIVEEHALALWQLTSRKGRATQRRKAPLDEKINRLGIKKGPPQIAAFILNKIDSRIY